MSGRKHHFIQQHLLRGFAIAPRRRPAQLWVFRGSAEPFICATENYGAERDFYGDPENADADEMITDAENDEFNSFIDAARQAVPSVSLDPDKAAAFVMHLHLRSRLLRNVFTRSVDPMIRHFDAVAIRREVLEPFVTALLAKHATQIPAIIESQIGRKLEPHVREALTEVVRANGPSFAQQFLDERWTEIKKGVAEVIRRIPEMARSSHNDAIRKSLNSGGPRLEEMRRYSWSIREVSEPLLLGDCCVFAETIEGRATPIPDKSVSIKALFLPVCSHRYIEGAPETLANERTPAYLNQCSVNCSFESYCASTKTPPLLDGRSKLGTSAMPLTPEAIHQIAEECVARAFEEQLSKGLT